MGRVEAGGLTPPAPLAERIEGHWRREWLRWPEGEDATTHVHWLQAGALYADIRVPSRRPDLTGAVCLADLDVPALHALMAAEGFAGTIALDGDVCTWTREINWHGQPETVDAGRLSLKGDALIEDGVHATYRELWQRQPGSPLAARRIAGAGLQGVLVASDEVFLLALGDPEAPPARPLVEALARGERPEGLARHFASLYALGRWEGRSGVARLATDPLREGCPILERWNGGIRWHRKGFEGGEETVTLSLTTV